MSFCVCVEHSVVSDSLRPYGLWPARLLGLWDFPGKNTRVGCHALLQGVFPTQGSNLGLWHRKQLLYHLSRCHRGSREFLALDDILSSGCTSLLTHSLPEGHLSCFQVLAIGNKAAIKARAQGSAWTHFQLLWANTKGYAHWIIRLRVLLRGALPWRSSG